MDSKEEQIKLIFDHYRGMILNIAELNIDPRAWPKVRAHLLKLLSQDRGLEDKIMKAIK